MKLYCDKCGVAYGTGGEFSHRCAEYKTTDNTLVPLPDNQSEVVIVLREIQKTLSYILGNVQQINRQPGDRY
jgi:hypothetical protein